MGYVKAIIYGQTLELYTYAKDIRPTGGKRRPTQSRIGLSNVGDDGKPQKHFDAQKRRDNANRAGMAFRRLVSANLGQSSPPLLVTCTYAQNQEDLRIGYKDFHAFIRAMRVTCGSEFRYIVVPEFQKRGALHFHTLFWGLPENLAKEERTTRMVATLWGRGFVDVYLTDGNEKISTYLAKYMSKSYCDIRLAGWRAYRASRNILRPRIERNLGGLAFVSEVYGIGGDNPPCEDKEYATQWLGKGRYRRYQINSK